MNTNTNIDISSVKYKVPQDHLLVRMNELKPYNCLSEKNALLLDDASSYRDYAKIITDQEVTTEQEAIFYILKLREMSISDIIDVTIECPHCRMMNSFQLEVKDFYCVNPKRQENVPVTLKYAEEILSDEVYDTLTLGQIDKITQILVEYRDEILPGATEHPCMKCKKDIKVFVDPKDIVSKVDLLGLYREYFELGRHLNWGKNDIDTMIPFERKIFIDMLKKESQ